MNNFASAQFTQDPKTVIKSLALRSKVPPQDPRFVDQTNRSNTIRRIIWRAVKELDRKMRDPNRCILGLLVWLLRYLFSCILFFLFA